MFSFVFSPRLLTNLVLTGAAALVAGVFWLILQLPYVGISLERQGEVQALTVKALEPWAAASGLQMGDHPIAVARDGDTLALKPETIVLSAQDRRRNYATKALFFEEQDRLHSILSQPGAQLTLADGRVVHLPEPRTREIDQLPLAMWQHMGLGLLAWIFALTVWVWRPLQLDTTFLMLSGLGLFITTIPPSVYFVDTLRLYPGWVTRGLSHTTAIGNASFLAFTLAAFSHFPTRLKSARCWVIGSIGGTSLFLLWGFLNDWDFSRPWSEQELYFSDPEIYTNVLVAFALVVVLCCLQWINSKNRPIERARASWVVFSVLLGPSILIVFYLLPSFLGQDPPLSRAGGWLMTVSTYALIVLGVGRFKFFQLEQYVATAWLWTGITLFFFVLDILLVSIVKLGPQTSTFTVLILIIWGYLPLRQWLQDKSRRKLQERYNTLFSDSVVELISQSLVSNQNPKENWQRILDRLFSPASIAEGDRVNVTRISQRGQSLLVSESSFSPPLKLQYADKGARLFIKSDVDLVDALQLLFQKLFDSNIAFFSGQTQERDRIRRDLHDQIGHQLLSLVYSAKDASSRQMAQETLEQLRDIIRALRDEPVPISSVLADIHSAAKELSRHANLELQWDNRVEDYQSEISSHQCLNILNIIRELINNSVKHADCQIINIKMKKEQDRLHVSYEDDGIGFDTDEVTRGNGLSNIGARVQELSARIEWQNVVGTQVLLEIPIDQ